MFMFALIVSGRSETGKRKGEPMNRNIKVNRIDIRRVVEDACHDLISDKKLAEMLYIKIMQPLEDYLDDCEEVER